MRGVDTTQRASRPSPQGRDSSRPSVVVLDPSDPIEPNLKNADPDAVHNNRRTAENFSRTTNPNPSEHTNHTNFNQDPNETSGKNAFENIIGKGRTAVDKFGTTLMWGAGGFAGLLYLGLGWKKLAMFVGALGVGAGWFLKTKLAKVGEEPDHNQRIVNEIKAMNLSKELEKEIFQFLNQRLTADAYKNSEGQNLSDRAKDILRNAAQQAMNTAQQAASTMGNNFNNQPGTQPA
ncbi:MAG: hypothetical protein EBR67_00520 [Proteobacteria bacterium]|nr:hypothetical protein [Pseudomonadota bacterium]